MKGKTESPVLSSEEEYPLEFTEREYRKIVHRIDRRLVTVVGVCSREVQLKASALTDICAAHVLRFPHGPNQSFSCQCSWVRPEPNMYQDGLLANAWDSMEDDLHLKVGYRYSIVTLVFFPTYIVCQIPSTIIVRAIGPRIHLGTITIVWGGLMIAMGFVKDWQALAGLRVLLGVLEVRRPQQYVVTLG
jgi:hypothetical protein